MIRSIIQNRIKTLDGVVCTEKTKIKIVEFAINTFEAKTSSTGSSALHMIIVCDDGKNNLVSARCITG